MFLPAAKPTEDDWVAASALFLLKRSMACSFRSVKQTPRHFQCQNSDPEAHHKLQSPSEPKQSNV